MECQLSHHRMFSVLGGHDKNVWKYNINGEYSVNSAYWMLANDHNASVINNWSAKLWNRLWSLTLPFKLVIFFWKLCANCLPIRKELHKRIPQISPFYPICHNEEKSLEHLFLLCPMVRAIWFRTDLTIRTEEIRITALKD